MPRTEGRAWFGYCDMKSREERKVAIICVAEQSAVSYLCCWPDMGVVHLCCELGFRSVVLGSFHVRTRAAVFKTSL